MKNNSDNQGMVETTESVVQEKADKEEEEEEEA